MWRHALFAFAATNYFVLVQEYNGHKYLKRYIYERAMCDLCQKTFELEKAYLCQCKLEYMCRVQ
jgi:hypothetical protein